MTDCDEECIPPKIEKKLFRQTAIRKDGLVIQIHKNISSLLCGYQQKRFVCSAFDKSGLLSASGDTDGNIFIVDLSINKWWLLPKCGQCSILIFSPHNDAELIIGCQDGLILVINVHLGTLSFIFSGLSHAVKNISFAHNLCLAASSYHAVIFNMETFKKVYDLNVKAPVTIKQMFFLPVTHNILACFSDDYIHIWKSKTMEGYKKLLPSDWNKFILKSIDVTRNGTTMVLAGLSSKLLVFSLDSWTLTKIMTLPEYITIKTIQFVSRPHDDGANKYLILLSNNGVLHFLNMEQNVIVGKIQQCSEVVHFFCSKNGLYLAAISRSGEVNIYKLSYFLEPTINEEPCECKTCKTHKKKLKLCLLAPKKPKLDLNLGRLQTILKKYGEYPSAYRKLIWTKILLLPQNIRAYQAIFKKGINAAYQDLEKKYPIVNTNAIKNLKRLLSNLGNWCPILINVDFLPLFVFPFVKIFENDPIVCFEAVVTIILNWCQHWFEFIPQIPANVLAIIENVFGEHDPQLLSFLIENKITSQIYAWIMLEVAFSETFTIHDWCILWDHILSNEPAFLLMVPVAYNILNRCVLAGIKSQEQFENFYHNQNPIDLTKLISKCYYLLEHTSENNHPRKYLKSFEKLTDDLYPAFCNYSKVTMTLEEERKKSEESLKKMDSEIDKVQSEILKIRESNSNHQLNNGVEQTKSEQLQQLEEIYEDNLRKQRENEQKRKLQLSKLRTELLEMQAEAMTESRRKMEEIALNGRKRELEKLIKNIECSQIEEELEVQLTEEELSKHYVELLKQKTQLEDVLLASTGENELFPDEYKEIDKQRQKINDAIEKLRKNISLYRISNKVDIPVGLSLINDKTQKLDVAMATEMAKKQQQVSRCHSNVQILKMENETRDLEEDVCNLLQKLTETKLQETNSRIENLCKSVRERKELIDAEEYLVSCVDKCCSSTFPFQ